MKDLTTTMDITMQEEAEQQEAAARAEEEQKQQQQPAKGDEEFPGTEDAIRQSMKEQEAGFATTSTHASPPTVVVDDEKTSAGAGTSDTPPVPPRSNDASPTPSSTSRKQHQIPIRPALTEKSHEDLTAAGEGDMSEEALRRKEKKKGGLSREQREQLAAFEKERALVRQQRVETLSSKLVDRISVWTETDKSPLVTKAFQDQMRLEVENLKMESFGIDILHAIGQTYVTRASTLLRSQKFLGIGGFFSKLRDKGNMVKDTWHTISSAIDAQQTMEDMARREQEGGDDWDDEKRAEYERRLTGKILNAAWRGSKFEIQSVLREVCDSVLYDKKVPLQKRLERAQALVLVGDVFVKVSRLLGRIFTHLTRGK